MSIASPAIITGAVIRSILQTVGIEQVVIDFLAATATGSLAVVFAIIVVGVRSSRSIHPRRNL
jgi:ABC-type spermidine/putrescine transport system permease subunit II